MLRVADRPVVGAQAVVVDDRGRVLLQLRPWPAGWEPPGGHVGPAEDPAVTVVRETKEETGLEIQVERLVGYYRFSGIRHDTDVVFRAHAVGGRLRRSREAWTVRWVYPDQLPRSLFPWYQQRIQDAVAPPPDSPFERLQPVGLGAVGRHGLALVRDLLSSRGRSPAQPPSP
ncbi:MAG TPA: NUDIX domain-containing protein [Candidatus Nanopelagicaceae bacterium]|nr:NUDIX domain-containing protein [Candidatus Nanopelagicaceae bacterium]